MPGVIEMRTYKTKLGMRQRFMDILVERSFPVFERIGMKVLGPFPSVEDADTFFWMRGFPDLSSRDRMRSEFYDGAIWKSELENMMMPMLEKYEVVLIHDRSGMLDTAFR